MIDDIRNHFAVQPGRIYLDAATYGLPPKAAVEAYRQAIDGWERGDAHFETDWEPEGERCRQLFARLIGANPDHVCLLPSVSVGVGTLAASLPAGSTILVPEDEFASLALPFVAMARLHGHQIRETPWEGLADAIEPGLDVVACSLTRAQDGRTIDLAGIAARTTAAGAILVIDATHALPFVPVEDHLERIDFLVCHGYKHLLSPRGTAFGYLNPRIWSRLAMVNANWRSSGHSYGTDLPEPRSAAAFDISLAWHAWVGTRPALELLLRWKEDGSINQSLTLAKRLATALEVPEPKASLVCLPVPDPVATATSLDGLGLRCAGRGDYLRLSTHVWNTTDDVDRAAGLVQSVLAGG